MRLAFLTHRALPQLTEDDRLAVAELRQHGVAVESAVWDSPLVDWARYDALIIRSTWDYHQRADDFEAWLAHVEKLQVPLWNPPGLVRWNMDRRYLLDLADRGVATVPTFAVDQGEKLTLADIAAETGWDDLVYRPSISAAGFGAAHVAADEYEHHAAAFAELVAERDVLVQPLVREIADEGEWSLVFFAGQYSHAVHRRSAERSAPLQAGVGGTVTGETPRAALVAQAAAIVAHLPSPWLYARVDACESDGALLLMQLKLIEPHLFLAQHPSATRRFAASVRRLVAGRRTPFSFTPRSTTPPHGTGS